MKYFYLCVVAILLFSVENVTAQITTEDLAVKISATVDTVKPSITLKWDVNNIATGYFVSRKTVNSPDWGTRKNLSSSVQTFVDTSVVLDSAYEYWVHRNTDSTDVHSDGYIYVSIKLHPTEYNGKIILLVDSTYSDSMATELTRLKFDLIGDGYTVIRHNVSRTDSVNTIRRIIKADYLADTVNVNTVFIFGHVPVPYSGCINPDGHPNHLGAWPADGIYGDMHGVYTDTIKYDTAGIILANQNVAGDGKYDQSLFAGKIELQVGRVDLSNFTLFTKTEAQLLLQYLNKDHAFRQKQFTPRPRGLVNDNFGPFYDPDLLTYEGFASCGWRDFPTMFGDSNVFGLGFFNTLDTATYLWAYACGGGDFTGAGGVGSTQNYAQDTVKAVFTTMFGSYFGDWNVQDNFLRSPLASQPLALSCAWSGRPYWHFHFMASGLPLGYCARWAQSNYGTYSYNFADEWVHIALMGDPTLTLLRIRPAANLQLKPVDSIMVAMHWTPSGDTIRGYSIFRSPVLNGQYTRIATVAANDTTFTDSLPLIGNDYYMVRALKLQQTASGYYYNLSEGIIDSVSGIISGIKQLTLAVSDVEVYPNPASTQVSVTSHQLPIQKIEIDNLLGQQMMVYNLEYNNAGVAVPLDVHLLPAGTYFVIISSGNSSVTKKVTVVR